MRRVIDSRIAALQTIGLTRIFRTSEGPLTAIDNISFAIKPGEFVSLVGHSGSGKTTLLYCLSGLDQASDGVVMLGGMAFYDAARRPSESSLTELRTKHIGFIFQNYHLLASLTAVENVMVPLRILGTTRKEAREQALEILAEVGMAHRHGHLPYMMSGGEQQRVAVARALVAKPRVILADEPTGNLDYDNGLKVIKLLQELSSKHNTAILMVSHVGEHAERADRVISMKAGKIIDDRPGGAKA